MHCSYITEVFAKIKLESKVNAGLVRDTTTFIFTWGRIHGQLGNRHMSLTLCQSSITSTSQSKTTIYTKRPSFDEDYPPEDSLFFAPHTGSVLHKFNSQGNRKHCITRSC